MAQINFSLPDGLKARIDEIVAQGNYASASDYLRDLVRRDQARAADLAQLQAMIDAGVSSGIDPREPADVIEGIIANRNDRVERLEQLRAALQYGKDSGVSTRTLEDIYADRRRTGLPE